MIKENINIAIICHDFTLSGANRSLLDWITTVDKNKYKITCVIPRRGKQFEEICKKNSIPVIRGNYIVTQKHLYKLNCKESIKNVIKNVIKICINPISFIILKNKLKRRNIKLIHSNSFAILLGVKIAMSMNIPHLWHVREFMEEDHKITHFESKEKIKKYCEYSNAVFISDVIKYKYDSLFHNEKHVLYDKVVYEKNYLKEKEFCENEKCNIMIAGTLSSNKGQIDAIKAIEELKKRNIQGIKLYICGIGNDEEKLKQYAKKQELYDVVKFMGQVQNLTELRKEIDIALVCSKNEALGRVTVEGMYYENLVVGANAGCTPYILENGKTGLLYNCGDYKQLADIIENIIKNKKNYIKVIEEAKKSAIDKFYNIDYNEKIFSIYDNILDRR